MPRIGVSRNSVIGLLAVLAMGAAVGSAQAHPGHDDSVAQKSTCALPGQPRPDDLQARAPSPTAIGQIDAVLIEAGTRSPIPGGKVVLTGVDACGDFIHRHLTTGRNGQVSFRALQPGRYQVTAYTSAAAVRSISSTDIDLTVSTRKTLQFTAGIDD
ncbi:carboxypeptidase-like regulatory domain-containing protein [Nocardia sp. NPDC059177]|uniref:carboxypeptidase-like regulatory domain-containing protein n=1 Tax=Nocardia sp. NPDC059177 TaxID=3346759 RepID=UPI0036AD9E28